MTWTEVAAHARLLIVDDAMENIQVLHQALQDDYDVLFALNGPKAIDMAHQQRPDLILLDAVMPQMDGYAVCAALRASAATRDIPVMFVTALTTAEDETRALEAGAVDFISKPLNMAVVRARVRTQVTIKRQSDVLRALTLTDGLTGVSNRRAFDEALDREWRRCARAGLPCSLIMVDIDHFKNYNDSYGHQAGDACLQEVSAALARAARRPQDTVARYGGEEFAILLPTESMAGAEEVAKKVLAEIDLLGIEHNASSVGGTVSVSMGVATMTPRGAAEPAQLIKAADALLYQAKSAGRKCYMVAGD